MERIDKESFTALNVRIIPLAMVVALMIMGFIGWIIPAPDGAIKVLSWRIPATVGVMVYVACLLEWLSHRIADAAKQWLRSKRASDSTPSISK